MFDVDERQLEAAGEQRQKLHLDGRATHVGRFAPGAHPAGIADLEPADARPRLQREGVDVKMAEDVHLPLSPRREVAGQRRPEPVPGEQGEEHRDGDGERGPDPGRDDQAAAPARIGPGVADAGLDAGSPGAEPLGKDAGTAMGGRGTGHAAPPQSPGFGKLLPCRIVPSAGVWRWPSRSFRRVAKADLTGSGATQNRHF